MHRLRSIICSSKGSPLVCCHTAAKADDKVEAQADRKSQTELEDSVKMMENKQTDMLINMTLLQAQQTNNAIEEWVIKQEFKYVFDEHIRDKERFDTMIEKRERDINEQLREIDELLESLEVERSEVEKVIGEFADTQKKHTNFRDEVTRLRIEQIQQVISGEILFQENDEINEEASILYKKVAAMKEINGKGLNELNNEAQDSKYAASILKDKNDKFETEIKSKVEEFNKLKIEVMDTGITYMTKRKPVQIGASSEFQRAKSSKSPFVAFASSDNPRQIPVRDRYEDKLLGIKTNKLHHNSEQECNSIDINKSLGGQMGLNGIEKTEKQYTDKTNENMEADCKKNEGNHFENKACTAPESSRVGDVPSRIPRPILQPHDSAYRYGERFLVTKSNSPAVFENDAYKRDNLVLDVERHVTKPTMDYINTETELRKLKGKVNVVTGNERFDPTYQRGIKESSCRKMEHKPPKMKKMDIKSKIDTGLSTTVARRGTIKDNVKVINDSKVIPKPPKTKKNEVRSKINTGLRNGQKGPINSNKNKLPPLKHTTDIKSKIDTGLSTTVARRGTIKDNVKVINDSKVIPKPPKTKKHEVRSKINTGLRNEQKGPFHSNKNKLPQHATRTENDLNQLPKSSRSFGEKTPLPEIKQSHPVRSPPLNMHSSNHGSCENVTNKLEAVPQISRTEYDREPPSNDGNETPLISSRERLQSLPVIASEQSQQLQQTTTDAQKPEPLRLSLTPTPPSTPCTSRKRKRSGRGQNSPDKNDSSRVPTERA